MDINSIRRRVEAKEGGRFMYGDRDAPECNAIIEPLAPELFRAPWFVAKTASQGLVDELNELLQDLRMVNEEHQGEPVLETLAFLNLSGRGLELQDSIVSWCGRYFEPRAHPDRMTPKDHNDPICHFFRLVEEFDNIFGTLAFKTNDVNYFVLKIPVLFTRWFLATRLCAGVISFDDVGMAIHTKFKELAVAFQQDIGEGGWFAFVLDRFLRRIESQDGVALSLASAMSEDELCQQIRLMASDLQEMRPFLIKNFHPERMVIRLADQLYGAWEWCLLFGTIAHIHVADTERQVLEKMYSRTGTVVSIGTNGLMFDWRMPWDNTLAGAKDRVGSRLASNRHVLEQFYQKLYESYEKVNFDRIRGTTPSVDHDDANVEERVLASVVDLAARADVELADHTHPVGRLPQIRLEPFLVLLERKFGCEVKSGKGSEVTLYRSGGRKVVVGRHKRNRELHSSFVTLIIRRLGIRPSEWLQVVGA